MISLPKSFSRRILAGAAAATLSLALAAVALAAAPRNDSFRNAREIALPSITTGTVIDATRERGEPPHSESTNRRTVWYRLRPRSAGPIALNTCSTTFDTVLAVYEGRSVRALNEVASNDDFCGSLGSRVSFDAVGGRTYRVAVSVFDDARVGRGRFELVALRVRPARNDAFADAASIRVGHRRTISTEAATAEADEPAHADSPAAHSVWFRFAPSRSETVTLDTFASAFDTVVGVYRGDSVGALTEVASNDDGRGQSLASRVRFRATAGETYLIAVDGFQDAAGDAVLRLSR